MGVLVVAGQARPCLVKGKSGEQGDAVEGLLTVTNHVVAKRLDLQPRKGLVGALGLLQADDLRRTLFQPDEEIFEPLPYRIDVPGSNAPGVGRPLPTI
jgi:hypothetical protein